LNREDSVRTCSADPVRSQAGNFAAMKPSVNCSGVRDVGLEL
jgi:hypothetical protein